MLAALKGNKTIADIARERDISETLLRRWREQRYLRLGDRQAKMGEEVAAVAGLDWASG